MVYLVTGGTGFLGSHCVQQLLAAGKTVKTTVRDPESKKCAFLKQLPGSERLSLAKADLLDELAHWREVVRGCDIVLHTASPFQVDKIPKGKEEEFFVRPAVQGTETVLQACLDEGVRRVVLTSSIASIIAGHTPSPKLTPPGPDESVWTNIDGLSLPGDMYVKSKTLAERAAWKLVEGKKMELAVVNPSYILGPLLNDSGGEASAAVLKALLNREYPMAPDIPLLLVDVRDVAKMHLLAADSPSAAGKRHVTNSTKASVSIQEVAQVLGEKYPNYPVPTRKMPYFVLYLASFFDSKVSNLLPSVGQKQYMNSTNGEALIGTWIDWRTSVKDMAESMIQRGLVKKPA